MLETLLTDTQAAWEETLARQQARLKAAEIGTLVAVGRGIALASGLPGVRAQELVECPGEVQGLAFNLEPEVVGIALLGPSESLAAGTEVWRTGRVADVPVGSELCGRVLNALGQPLDERPPPRCDERWAIEREPPPIVARAPVDTPLQTGIKVIDAAIPIGRGQRQLILGDRQTGKTAIALDIIINQRGRNVICIYCAIGQRGVAVARAIETLQAQRALAHTIVITASPQDPPGLQYITPYAATTIAEYFMQRGQDVLIVYDDLTRHARAYRELSLLLRRPPGREAYPGDIFYVHARLLERATQLKPAHGGGSLTALPIIETEAENIAAYIPTNLISITDGQIYLSPSLYRKGILPAVDVGKSVSRVGGRAQLPAYRRVLGPLKLVYSQFEELEVFARFGTRLDDETRRTLERGRRVRAILKQGEQSPLSPAEQIAVLLSVTSGVFDEVPLHKMPQAERSVQSAIRDQLPSLCQRINAGETPDQRDWETILTTARHAVHQDHTEARVGNA